MITDGAPPFDTAGAARFHLLHADTPEHQLLHQGCDSDAVTLAKRMADDGESLLGKRGGKGAFPVQIRLFEAVGRQPLQVCGSPTGRQLGNSLFWYSLGPADTAGVAAGLKSRMTRGQFERDLDSQALWDHLRVFPAPPGDAFFMAPGTVFAADAGSVLIEVSRPGLQRHILSRWGQSSNTGETPPSEDALHHVRFERRTNTRIRRDVRNSGRTRKIPILTICPDFQVDELRLTDYFFGRTDGSVPHVLCTTGQRIHLRTDGGACEIPRFAACIVPACAGDYRVETPSVAPTVLRIIPKSP